MRVPAYNMFLRHSVVAPTVSVSGSVAHGNTLVATAANYDSLQWYAGSTAIPGQTGSSYVVTRSYGGFANGITCVASSTAAGTTTSNALVYSPTIITTSRGWYRADTVTNVSGATQTLTDKLGNGNDLVAQFPGNRPTWFANGFNGGTRPYMRFDGIANGLHKLSFNFDGSPASLSTIITYKDVGFGSGNRVLAYGASPVEWEIRQQTGNVALIVSHFDAAATNLVMNTTARMVGALHNGTHLRGWIGDEANTAAVATTSLPVNSGTLSIGMATTGGAYANIDVSEILVVRGAMTQDQMSDYKTYVYEQYGLISRSDVINEGTFTRSTEGSYLSGSFTDGSTPFLYWASTNVRRIENDKLLMEGSRTNLQTYSRDLSGAGWSAGVASQSYNVNGGPDGANLADRVTALASEYSANRTIAGNGAHVASEWARAVSGTAELRMLINVPGVTAIYPGIGTTYQRVSASLPNASGTVGYIPVDQRATGSFPAVAADVYVDLHQIEAGVFPTSVIRTTTTSVTRGSDALSFAVGQYPSSFLTTGFTFKYTPLCSSAEHIATMASHRLIHASAATSLIQFTGGAAMMELYCGGVQVTTLTGLSWSRGQELTITVEPSIGRLTISGATTGNGTNTGTGAAWASGPFLVSPNGTSFGHFSRYITAL